LLPATQRGRQHNYNNLNEEHANHNFTDHFTNQA
jgi:hypothetical protein